MTMFATLDQLAIRLSKTDADEFTAAQAAQGELLLELATGLIAHAVDETAAWAEALDPVPDALVSTCLDVCVRAIGGLAGGGGVASETETLGAYSHTTRYASSDSGGSGADSTGLALTAAEERRVRRAVTGTSVASVEVGSIFESDFDAELLA